MVRVALGATTVLALVVLAGRLSPSSGVDASAVDADATTATVATTSPAPLATLPPTTTVAMPSTVPTTIAVTPAAPATTNPPTAPPVTVPATTVPATTVPATTVPPTTVVERSGANVDPVHDIGDPVSIAIPSIGVDSVLVPTGVLADGTVDVPVDPSIAGWYTGGPRPGERGPAVIMGHVDSKKYGPGVFWHLVDLQIGAVVTIQTTTGSEDFVVQDVQQFPKNEFPTDLVYGPVPEPALRLITCGGSFDRSIGHYRDNVVAFLVPVTP